MRTHLHDVDICAADARPHEALRLVHEHLEVGDALRGHQHRGLEYFDSHDLPRRRPARDEDGAETPELRADPQIGHKLAPLDLRDALLALGIHCGRRGA